MSEALRIVVVGAAGRMGQEILALVRDAPGLELGAAIVANEEEAERVDYPDVRTPADAAEAVATSDVVIDFSSPAGFGAALATAHAAGCAIVAGTTGLGAEHHKAIDAAARDIPVLWSANFSVGVNVLEHLVTLASGALDDFDVEVFEAHHRNKVDAPSGTALFLGEAAARARDVQLQDVATWARDGIPGARTDDEIGFQVVRGGTIVGEHTVYFCGTGERVELTHRAQDRVIFARGALRAARWIVGREPGRYSMRDVLFG